MEQLSEISSWRLHPRFADKARVLCKGAASAAP